LNEFGKADSEENEDTFADTSMLPLPSSSVVAAGKESELLTMTTINMDSRPSAAISACPALVLAGARNEVLSIGNL
jgi:hypothetical protein